MILKKLYHGNLKVWSQGNISGSFSANNMKKIGLNGCVYDFSVDYKIFNTSEIINIHKYLIKKHNVK